MDQISARFSTESVLEPSVSPVVYPPLLNNPAVGLPDNSPESEPKTDNPHETEPTMILNPSPVQVETVNIPRYPVQERRPPDRLSY